MRGHAALVLSHQAGGHDGEDWAEPSDERADEQDLRAGQVGAVLDREADAEHRSREGGHTSASATSCRIARLPAEETDEDHGAGKAHGNEHERDDELVTLSDLREEHAREDGQGAEELETKEPSDRSPGGGEREARAEATNEESQEADAEAGHGENASFDEGAGLEVRWSSAVPSRSSMSRR